MSATNHMQRDPQSGFVGYMILRLVLLFVVLAQVVFLGGHFSKRWDLTGDGVYQLTESTKKVVGRLDETLLIEAYFSEDSKLPAAQRPARQALRSLLDEYVELSKGRVVVRFYDPQSNEGLREKALRLGIETQRVRDSVSGERADKSVAFKEVWQGLRFRYKNAEQRIVRFLPLAAYAFQYEVQLTPLIKDLTQEERPPIGIAIWNFDPDRGQMIMGGSRVKPRAFSVLIGALARYFNLQPVDLRMGQLIPEHLDKLILIRPTRLSDRMKYAFDQFLMRGGKLIIFADTHGVDVRKEKPLRAMKEPADLKSLTRYKFKDQMAHYGVELDRDLVVSDSAMGTWQVYQLALPNPNAPQGIEARPMAYPYLFAAVDRNWADDAAAFVPRNDNARPDPLAVEQLKAKLEPGVNKDSEFMKKLARGGVPGFFWPTRVGLTKDEKPGLKRQVLLRTSPMGRSENFTSFEPDPFLRYGDAEGRLKFYGDFVQALQRRHQALPPKQVPLMVEVKGTFTSYFAGKEIPERPKPKTKKKKVEKEDDVLDWGDEDPDNKDPEKKDDKKDDSKKKDDEDGPQVAKDEEKKDEAAKGPKDPPFLAKGQKESSLIVIGDSDFIRDDFVRNEYLRPKPGSPIQIIGPAPRGTDMRTGSNVIAPRFLRSLLDWLVGDSDLEALYNKEVTDRSLELIKADPTGGQSYKELTDKVAKRQNLLQNISVGLPLLLLAAFGIITWLRRHSQKVAFLRSIANDQPATATPVSPAAPGAGAPLSGAPGADVEPTDFEDNSLED